MKLNKKKLNLLSGVLILLQQVKTFKKKKTKQMIISGSCVQLQCKIKHEMTE